jgi:hypothetical protein
VTVNLGDNFLCYSPTPLRDFLVNVDSKVLMALVSLLDATLMGFFVGVDSE